MLALGVGTIHFSKAWCEDRNVLVLTVVVLSFLLSGHISAGTGIKTPVKVRETQAIRLLETADSHFHANHMDAALGYYRQLADRYSTAISGRERRLCLEGVYGCFEVNLRQGRYEASFEDISMAGEIVEANSLPDYKLNMYHGAFYVVLAAHTPKKAFNDKVLEYSRKAFRGALSAHDDQTAYRAFGNMVTACQHSGRLSLMAREEAIMRRHADTCPDNYPRLALLMLSGARAAEKSRFTEAAAAYDSMLRILPSSSRTQRTRAAFLKNKGDFLAAGADYTAAVRTLRQAERLTYVYNLRDIRLAILSIYQRICEATGDSLGLPLVKQHVLALCDSLKSHVVVDNLAQLEYMKERRDMQTDIKVNALRARVSGWALVVAVAVGVVILIFLLVLRHKNRRLRQHSLMLYERIQRILEDSAARPSPGHAPAVKYENSKLDEKDKEEMAEAIKRIMDSDAIFSPDISLASFSRLVGRNQKAVSQVIHERYNCSFTSLINRARIMEACRRMEMPRYAGYSTEGIAESVGFVSRNTFDSNFKRFTGVGLRAYRKAATESRKTSEKQL